jgi:hypothetical protein
VQAETQSLPAVSDVAAEKRLEKPCQGGVWEAFGNAHQPRLCKPGTRPPESPLMEQDKLAYDGPDKKSLVRATAILIPATNYQASAARRSGRAHI